ncbi:DUF11 domain-containing protein [Coraliomargarita akajimensis]|uniref:Conserved repeat domain protein n=1 Tax=Coraliomargarita akajimensis (strain DSM 45221 / IAM 15411 / JCM 23193 / KCTC 12865 / 04OKA010-24) TaxID=583355 RepID=D5EIR6_CORAD|nr:DUF11 domain-containing protein [Coraliomargarita akajimensis]ADE54315.1 conserved repeat domain protein [Coraliomargarita akajimensis DSM 45221]
MRHLLCAYCAAGFIVSGFVCVEAAGTSANTEIINTARVDYTVGTSDLSDEDSATMTVAQLLDVTVTAENSPVNVSPGQIGAVTIFRITNTGNGGDTIELTANSALTGSDEFDPTLQQIWLDDGDGSFDSGTDTLYQAGVNDPLLDADASVTVFLLNEIPSTGVANGDNGDTQLTASSALQSAPLDPAGTVYAGQGVGGVSAVVGNTQASGSADARHTIQAVVITMTKTNEILAAFNTDTIIAGEVVTEPIPGAVITYTLTIEASGSGTATGVRITDTVPANTTYASGNFTLNTAALTEADDSDEGQVVSGDLEVEIPDMTGGDSHTVTFNVTINE